MIGVGAFQGPEPVVGCAIQVQHPGVGLDELDRGQEATALQALPVETVRFDVGSGDQGHSPLEEPAEQASQQHRVGDVAHLELVEADDSGVLRQAVGHQAEGILVPPERLELAVDVLHERVEVHAQLGRKRQRVEKGIHDQGLAPTHAAPQIDSPDWCATPGPEQAYQGAGTRTGKRSAQHALVEIFERVHRLRLGGVVTQPPLLDLPREALSGTERTVRRVTATPGSRGRLAVATLRVHFPLPRRIQVRLPDATDT